MFDSEQPNVYEKVYQTLLPKLASANLAANAAALGLEMAGPMVKVPCLGRDYLVDAQGVRLADGATPHVNQRIVLAYYMMHRGRGENTGSFVPYRELPGGADFSRTLEQLVDQRLAKSFSGRLDQLKAAGEGLGAQDAAGLASGDLVASVEVLPRVPLVFAFYDADEDFAAEAKVLYDLTAPNFLDLECLAVLGLLLVQELERRARG